MSHRTTGSAGESKSSVPPSPTVKLDPLGRAALLSTIRVPSSILVPPP